MLGSKCTVAVPRGGGVNVFPGPRRKRFLICFFCTLLTRLRQPGVSKSPPPPYSYIRLLLLDHSMGCLPLLLREIEVCCWLMGTSSTLCIFHNGSLTPSNPDTKAAWSFSIFSLPWGNSGNKRIPFLVFLNLGNLLLFVHHRSSVPGWDGTYKGPNVVERGPLGLCVPFAKGPSFQWKKKYFKSRGCLLSCIDQKKYFSF